MSTSSLPVFQRCMLIWQYRFVFYNVLALYICVSWRFWVIRCPRWYSLVGKQLWDCLFYCKIWQIFWLFSCVFIFSWQEKQKAIFAPITWSQWLSTDWKICLFNNCFIFLYVVFKELMYLDHWKKSVDDQKYCNPEEKKQMVLSNITKHGIRIKG